MNTDPDLEKVADSSWLLQRPLVLKIERNDLNASGKTSSETGATTLRITTFSLTTLDIMTLRITTLSATFIKSDTQNNLLLARC